MNDDSIATRGSSPHWRMPSEPSFGQTLRSALSGRIGSGESNQKTPRRRAAGSRRTCRLFVGAPGAGERAAAGLTFTFTSTSVLPWPSPRATARAPSRSPSSRRSTTSPARDPLLRGHGPVSSPRAGRNRVYIAARPHAAEAHAARQAAGAHAVGDQAAGGHVRLPSDTTPQLEAFPCWPRTGASWSSSGPGSHAGRDRPARGTMPQPAGRRAPAQEP